MANDATFKVPFGILNIKGLMAVNEDNVVELPIFAHSSYPITTTLDPTYSSEFGILLYNKPGNVLEGKSYQKIYRKNVRWNFGDGTEVEGYSASHYYNIPGKYTITCTFFDIHRLGILNQYKIKVIVKQVIPSELIFDKQESSVADIKCSKIEKIARVEALLSNNVKDNVDIIANLQSQYQGEFWSTLPGTAEALGAWVQIQKPTKGDVESIVLKCRMTEHNLVKPGPYYLGVWENTGVGAGTFVKKAVSTNTVTQKAGTSGVWHFDNLHLEGRAIRLQLLTSATGSWLASPPTMGLYTSPTNDGSFIRSALATANINQIPEGMIVIKGEKHEGKELNDWEDIKDLEFPHLRKYQTFLDKTTEYYYNSQVVYKEYFNPVQKYSPDYEDLYGYFDLNKDQIVFKCYRVQPYANKEKMSPITINNPNTSILAKEMFSTFEVNDVSTIEELPEEAKYVGKRAFIDVFYRSDFISPKDVVFISFDIDNINVHNSIEASTNFLNVPPLGLHFSVLPNDFTNVNFSCTLNGFLTSYEDIDKLVQLSIAKNYSFNTLLIPYFRAEYNEYYIPKDFDFNICNVNVTNNKDSEIILSDKTLSFLRTFNIDLKNELNSIIQITGEVNKTITFDFEVKDLDEVVIPTEKYYNQDVKKLIDVYTPHELFQHTPLLKQTLVDLFENKRMLDYVVTKSVNFFDDNVNAKTNYVTNLLSMLHMMGRDAFEYDQTTFEGVNELRDLCRILSMNHSELVGNLIDEDYDIKYTQTYKGKHIGDEVFVTDELYILSENELVGEKRHQKGKVAKIKRNGQILDLKGPTILVTRDLYTNETKMVNFSDISPDKVENNFNVFQLKNYKSSWGWGLLLPDKEDKDGKILHSYYAFYLLCKPDHIIRVGNFLEENTITPETETKATWEEADGKTYDKLQKVIYSALDMI